MTYGSWWSKKWNTPSRTKDIFFITKHDLSCGQLSCILALFCFVLVFFFFFSLYKTQYDEWKFVHVCMCVCFFFWLKLNKNAIWLPLKRWIMMEKNDIYIYIERERERDACKSHISFPKFEISTLFNWRRFRGTSSVGSSCGAQNPFG